MPEWETPETISQFCGRTGCQICHFCERLDCCDNTSEYRKERDALKADNEHLHSRIKVYRKELRSINKSISVMSGSLRLSVLSGINEARKHEATYKENKVLREALEDILLASVIHHAWKIARKALEGKDEIPRD